MKKIKTRFTKTQITRVPDREGKSIEEEMRVAIANKSPIEANSPLVYTDHADGVLPQYDIRTDRQELALDATDKYASTNLMLNDDYPQVEEKQEKQTTEENA